MVLKTSQFVAFFSAGNISQFDSFIIAFFLIVDSLTYGAVRGAVRGRRIVTASYSIFQEINSENK